MIVSAPFSFSRAGSPIDSTGGAQLESSNRSVSQPVGVLEEVIVTARKQEESLQKVPVSVTAVASAEIRARSATTLSDILETTPNVSFNTQTQTGGSTGMIFIRGIGQADGLLTLDPGVGVYLDGVYEGRMQGIDFNALDLERIEVLRGPQGTLFGRNTIGGAINVVSKEPDTKAAKTTGHFSAIAGNFGRLDATFNLNVPVIPNELAVVVSGTTRNERGYGRSALTGDDQSNVQNSAGRIAARYTPNAVFDVLATFDVSRNDDHVAFYKTVAINEQAPLVQLYNSVAPKRFDHNRLTDDFFANQAGPPSLNYGSNSGAALTVTAHLSPEVDMKSISAYRRGHFINDETIDATDPSVFPIYESLNARQISQELQVNGKSFENNANWVAGLYYFRELASDLSNFDAYPELWDLAKIDLQQIKTLRIDNRSYAGYGQGSYEIFDKTRLTAGIRYNRDEKDQSVFYVLGRTGVVLIPYTSKTLSSNSVTPRFGIDYQWTPDIMTYVSVASGYKTGGFNGRAGSLAEFNQYDPEKVWTYELGLRSELLERRLRFNLTAYYSNYRDIQVVINQATAGGNDSTVVKNAAAARIAGGEAELTWVPIDNLRVGTSAGLTDAKYLRLDPGVPFTTADHFRNTPKSVVSVYAEYSFPVGDMTSLTPRIDYTHRSTTYFEAVNAPLSTQPGYGLANARLTFDAGAALSVAGFVTNLADKHYFTGAFNFYDSLGFSVVNPGAPRQFGIESNYRF